jgi:hypothetical protein
MENMENIENVENVEINDALQTIEFLKKELNDAKQYRDNIRAKYRDQYYKNKAYYSEYYKKYGTANREKINADKLAYYHENKEKILRRAREKYQQQKLNNIEN